MYEKIVNLYKKARPVLNSLREKKLHHETQFKGTINQLLENLKNYDTIRYIGTNSNSYLTTTILALKETILSELQLHEKDLNFNQIYDFNCSVYKGKGNETLYADLEFDHVNTSVSNNILKKYITLKATKNEQKAKLKNFF
jgi:hypothetical protein